VSEEVVQKTVQEGQDDGGGYALNHLLDHVVAILQEKKKKRG
jgi:hypothetical protein